MRLMIPDFSLIVLVGASGSGKSSFARKHFPATAILSSDTCRGWVSDDENSLEATKDAFDVLHYIAAKRLAALKLTVIDATNVQVQARKSLLKVASDHHAVPIAIVFNLPESIGIERNKSRPDRDFGPHVVRNQTRELRRSLAGLRREGFRYIYELRSVVDVDEVEFERVPLWTDLRGETGPFDIVGDVHGCFEELCQLLASLGYVVGEQGLSHPDGRKAVFLGDLVDRGPNSTGVLKLVMGAVRSGSALCVPGNHDQKLVRKLSGRDVQLTHGIGATLEQLGAESSEFADDVREFLDARVSHYVLDGGKLVVAHAGMKEDFQGRASGRVRDFALYGETTGENDEYGLPIRNNWAAEYRGKARVVYGHTPILEPEWLNRTINVDTGCVFGGKLTALRYPELEIVPVPARQTYYASDRPFLQPTTDLSKQHENDDVLDIEDVSGKRIIHTRLRGNVTLREENAIAALEAMSRFATNPKWLIYLPPTMSPSETSLREGCLEYPDEGFAYYREQGIEKAVCEEKHMGSRAVVVVCRDEEVARRRFGVVNEGIGVVYTRTGRRFFDDLELERELLVRVSSALGSCEFWSSLESDWACLDCELMPWSAKAVELLKRQYASVGAASCGALSVAEDAARAASALGLPDFEPLMNRLTEKREAAELFVAAYRQYCRTTSGLDGYKLAPFHVLATEGKVHADKDHVWHMDTLAAACACDPDLLLATPYRVVDLADPGSCEEGSAWWEKLTASGGEGMVIKPWTFVASGSKGLTQPAVKCRGREYLRIIYGPEYTFEANLSRLRSRGLGRKRSLALREFALGIESSSGSSPESLCAECTNAFSGFWPWKANQWIRDCKPGGRGLERERRREHPATAGVQLVVLQVRHRALGALRLAGLADKCRAIALDGIQTAGKVPYIPETRTAQDRACHERPDPICAMDDDLPVLGQFAESRPQSPERNVDGFRDSGFGSLAGAPDVEDQSFLVEVHAGHRLDRSGVPRIQYMWMQPTGDRIETDRREIPHRTRCRFLALGDEGDGLVVAE